MRDEVLARAGASAPRRVIGVGFLATLGLLLFYVAVTASPAFGWQVFLLAGGALSLRAAQLMWRATRLVLELTREALTDSDGTVLARIADVERVDRGAFAFKPSNGFLLKTKQPQARGWRPGIWWRSGRRVAVGGVIPSAEAKFMADTISALKTGR